MQDITAQTTSLDHDHAIAIIGVACRLPGAPGISDLWDVLITERDTIRRMSTKRFDVDEIYQRNPARRVRIEKLVGGFLDDIDMFDAKFFGISPWVATRLDPQERMLLETSWEAVEDAGIPAENLRESNTGVYATTMSADYWDVMRAAGAHDLHAAVSAKPSATAAGLIAHHLDLRGPAMGLEATCASSLLAVHVACRALRHGEVDLAIVGGASIALGPHQFLAPAEARLLSPSGRCRFGDANADGYVRSDGAVAMVLKPLGRALADGDQIYAAIAGTSATNDGRSGGPMICPGLPGQINMLRAAYRDAGVRPGEIDFVEAHGPGTADGDRVELRALAEVLGEGRPADRPALVGSIKSNIGHTEAAAGVAGLLKAALAIRHRQVPATLHVEQPNAVLAEWAGAIGLAVRPHDLSDRPTPILAGVSSFGLTGTNVHVVLSEVPQAEVASAPRSARVLPYVLPVSAKDPAALRRLAGGYADQLSSRVAVPDLADACYSASARRTHHAHRLAVVADSRESLLDGLRAYEDGVTSTLVRTGNASGSVPPRIVFVFAGQGSQRPDMARELLELQPCFRDWMQRCDKEIEAEAGWSVIDRLLGDTALAGEEYIQPALWAIEVSLAALWREWGIEPDLVIGHSMGEVAAAVTAGALSLRAGAALICRRSGMLKRLQGTGAMLAVALGEAEADAALEAAGSAAGRVVVAAVNSDHATTLAGDPEALHSVVELLRRRGVYCRQLGVNYASHGPQVEPVMADLRAALAGLTPSAGRIPLHSTVFDRVVDGTELTADYWARNLRQQVRFAPAVRSALTGAVSTVFIEMSAHPVLTPAIEEAVSTATGTALAVPSLAGGKEAQTLMSALAAVYTFGGRPRWERIYENARFVPPPRYPWQRTSFWIGQKTKPAPEVATWAPRIALPARNGEQSPTDDLVRTMALQTADLLAMAHEDIDPAMPLLDAGLDSVLAGQLSARITRELGVAVPARHLLARLTLAELAEQVHEKIRAVGGQ
jgi:acyl transferase domain-containing protein